MSERLTIHETPMAVPRDIEPQVAQLPDVYLYSVDDLAQTSEQITRMVTSLYRNGTRVGLIGHLVQDLQARLYDLVRFAAFDIGHEANAARIMLVCWVV